MKDQITLLQERNTELVLENRRLEAREAMAGLLADVLAFHEKFGVEVKLRPETPVNSIRLLRRRLIEEEWEEFLAAWRNDNLSEIADSLADMVYVIVGTAIAYGIPLDKVWNEVQRTNMLKIGGSKRYDGKILKPEGWRPPEIAAILALAQRGRESIGGQDKG